MFANGGFDILTIGVGNVRLGLNIEFEGKNYDILELPIDAFVRLIPGLKEGQVQRLQGQFQEYWPDPTRCRHHILNFVAEQMGESLDSVLLTHETIRFNEADVADYVEEHVKQGNRLN